MRFVISLFLALALPVFAQQPPLVGFLNGGSADVLAPAAEAFRQGLKDGGGFVEGKNIRIEYRWAEGRQERLPELVKDLLDRRVAIIAATGGNAAVLAAKASTSTIPIVFTGGGDPVKLGLVASLSRPGGNITGITNIATSLQAKRLQVLHDFLPAAKRIAFVMDPQTPGWEATAKEVQATASAANIAIEIILASTDAELDAAFAAAKQARVDAVLVATAAFYTSRRSRIVSLAAQYAIPASYSFREFTAVGGLMSYGPNIGRGYRQVGVYVARILKGAKPADLPVVQINDIELVLNLKTAKALGLKISKDFVARVDEVIE